MAPVKSPFVVPRIPRIHAAVYAAATSTDDSLDMSDWHTCETTHCRAGWAVHLAGKEGKELEALTSTLFAAMQIYHASCPEIAVPPSRFFVANKVALADMARCAAEEEALITTATATQA